MKKEKPKDVSNGLGIAGLVLGILSILVSLIGLLAIVFGILAIIFSAIQIKKNKNGIAIAGLVTGILGIIFGVLSVVIFLGLLFIGLQEVYVMQDQTTHIPVDYFEFRKVSFDYPSTVNIKVDSSGEMNSYLLSDVEFSKYSDSSFNGTFYYIASSLVNATFWETSVLDLVAGEYYLVMENEDTEEIEVTYSLSYN